MPKRPSTSPQLPHALRDAVDRTVQATVGSAERGRERTQGAIDDLVGMVRGAEAQVTRGRRAVSEALDERRPATHEDIGELKAELRAIARRLDAIEERLPRKASGRQGAAKPAAAKRAGAAKPRPAKRAGAAKPSAAKRAGSAKPGSAKRSGS